MQKVGHMEITVLFISLRLTLSWFELNSALAFDGFGLDLKQRAVYAEVNPVQPRSGSSVKCSRLSLSHPPAFSMDGDYVIGGVFSIHYYMRLVRHNYTTEPEALSCTGRLGSGVKVLK